MRAGIFATRLLPRLVRSFYRVLALLLGIFYLDPVCQTDAEDARTYYARGLPEYVAAAQPVTVAAPVRWRARLALRVAAAAGGRRGWPRLAAPANAAYQPGSGPLSWQNAGPLVSRGLETYLRLRVDETELYLGYVFTAARTTRRIPTSSWPPATSLPPWARSS